MIIFNNCTDKSLQENLPLCAQVHTNMVDNWGAMIDPHIFNLDYDS